ncbi:MAG: hypothetical protein WD801_01420 [Gemmatimonadaceae bacterium]
MTRALRMAGIGGLALLLSAHVGSPDVFFSGKAGAYDVRVVVRPPDVVPGVARVTVRTATDVDRVSIRPVFWRAGTRGAPSADETRRLAGDTRTFGGSVWLMSHGAYTVEVTIEGADGTGSVQVPVASVATGRLAMGPGLGILLALLGLLLVAGLLTIVYKGAGESLVEVGAPLDAARRARARRVTLLAIPVIALVLVGGARWWRDVDLDYRRTIYRPSPLLLALSDGVLRVETSDTVFQPPHRPSALVPDHGKLMHLFMVRAGDAGAFAHLHPVPVDTSIIPAMTTRVPPLPAGEYHVYGDVVHETGFERTLVGTMTLDAPRGSPASADAWRATDPDDAWFAGAASTVRSSRLADGTTMHIELDPDSAIVPGRELAIRVSVLDAAGRRAALQPYLGMSAHAVVVRVDGAIYVHLHPMGTITNAAQEAFAARDRGDTTALGRLIASDHAMHAGAAPAAAPDTLTAEFPYGFPSAGNFRLFVQVKRNGRILTGAFAIPVAEPTITSR